MKGKTNQPLVLWIWHPWISHPKVAALHDAGNTIVAIARDGAVLPIAPATILAPGPDLILHPAAHRWHDELWDYLDVALKSARARKRREKT